MNKIDKNPALMKFTISWKKSKNKQTKKPNNIYVLLVNKC